MTRVVGSAFADRVPRPACPHPLTRRVAAGDGLRGLHRALLLRRRHRRQARVRRLPGDACLHACLRPARSSVPVHMPARMHTCVGRSRVRCDATSLVISFILRKTVFSAVLHVRRRVSPAACVNVRRVRPRLQAVANTLVTPLSTVAFSSVAIMGAAAQPLTPLTVVAIVVIPLGIVIFKWEDFTKVREENILSLIARH